MTHDELLDKIYWHWRKDPRGDGLQAMTDYRRTILAVVELHKPFDGYCQRCTVNNWGELRQEYPCDEIQAIEKELE